MRIERSVSVAGSVPIKAMALGAQVENARLATTEKAARARDELTVAELQATHLDVRDDRLLVLEVLQSLI